MKLPKIPASIYTMVVQGLELVSAVAVHIVVARMHGPDAMGNYVFAFALAGVLALFLHFGTGEIAIRMYLDEKEDRHAVFGATLVISVLGSVAAVIIAIIVGYAMQLSFDSFIIVWPALASLMINGLSAALQQPILALAKSRRDVPMMAISRVLLIGIVYVGCVKQDLYLTVAAHAIAGLVLTLGRTYVVNRHCFSLRPTWDKPTLKRLWRSGAQLGIGAIFGVISARSDMFLLKYLTTSAIVGYYGAAFRVVSAVVQSTLRVSAALFPGLIEVIQSGRMTWGRRFFTLFPIAVMISVSAAAIFLSDFIILVIFGPQYTAAIPLMRILLFTAGFRCIHIFANTYLIAVKLEKVIPICHAVAAVINVGLNLLLIPTYKGVGAAGATLASEIAALAILLTTIVWFKLRSRKV